MRILKLKGTKYLALRSLTTVCRASLNLCFLWTRQTLRSSSGLLPSLVLLSWNHRWSTLHLKLFVQAGTTLAGGSIGLVFPLPTAAWFTAQNSWPGDCQTLQPELQGVVTPCYTQQLPSQGVGDAGFSSFCPLIIDEVPSGLQRKRKNVSSSSPLSSFYPELQHSPECGWELWSRWPPRHHPGSCWAAAQARPHRNQPLQRDRFPRPPLPAPPHPGTAEAADEFFLIIVLWKICAEMKKRLETWGQTYAASIFEKRQWWLLDISLSITSFRNKGCVNSKEIVKRESRKHLLWINHVKLANLPFEKKVVLLVDFVMPVAQFGNTRIPKILMEDKSPRRGTQWNTKRLVGAVTQPSELNETKKHPYWCRIHSYLTCWINSNKEKWNLISGNEKS